MQQHSRFLLFIPADSGNVIFSAEARKKAAVEFVISAPSYNI